MSKIHNIKNIKKRNGQMSQLALLIIILISAIVIFLFITKFSSKSTFEQAITTCRMSVLTQYATELAPTLSGAKSPFDIDCEKRYVRFYNNKVELGLSLENMKLLPIRLEGQKVTRFGSLNDYVVNQVIAEELRVCKFQFADGKLNIFVNDDSNKYDQNICFVCSEISFDNSAGKNKIFGNLLGYTTSTKFDNNITYYDYLREKSYTGNIIWAQPDYDPSLLSRVFGADKKFANLDINTSEKYFVFYRVYSPANLNLLQWSKPQWVAIVPAKDISEYCTLQAN